MKGLILRLLKYGMRFIYFFMKLLTPVENKAVFLSRQSDAPSLNLRRIADELQNCAPSFQCEFYCRRGLKDEMGVSYVLLMLRQMKALAGAKLCFTESYCIPVSLLRHKKELKIIQIWHSMVAVKKFGWQTVDRPEGSSSAVAQIMQMHDGYDYVTVGSEYMRPFFAEAMRTPIERIIPIGAPVADAVLQSAEMDPQKTTYEPKYPPSRNLLYLPQVSREKLLEKFRRRYPQSVGKKIAVYLPTMRRGRPLDCAGLVERFDYGHWALTVKLHPLDSLTEITDSRAICDDAFTTEEAILVADAVISDYSGAAAEAALLNKPVYFFVPDTERYDCECGLNVNPLKVFPDVSFDDAHELIDAVCGERASCEDITHVKELLCGGCSGHSTHDIVELALDAIHYGK